MTATPPHNQAVTLAIEMRGVAAGSMRDMSLVVAEDVNWSVRGGDFWVLGGLQGSGKTDFLMMTASLMAPVEGSYLFFGEGMPIFEEERLATRLRLGLVFDGGQLFNHLTVAENVALPLRYHHNLPKAEAQAEVQKLLELTELAEWADSTPGAIGRNWRKRVGLARALILKPEVLLLDNPLAGLDVRHSIWWLNFLMRLNRSDEVLGNKVRTLVATADDLRPWRTRANQFAVLKDKRFTVLGTRAQLEAASDELVRELLAGEQESV